MAGKSKAREGRAGVRAVSAATVGRLPRYLRCLAELASREILVVSSRHLAEAAGVNPATLRRDFASIGIAGTRGVGYDVKAVAHAVGVALGVHQVWGVVVVGAGNLGRALANYGGMAERGFPVEAILDIDPRKVGDKVGHLVVADAADLGKHVAIGNISVGVISTPDEVAQDVADAMVEAGITSILTFTTSPLRVPDGVVVRRVDLATELQILSFYEQRTAGASEGIGVVDEGA